MKTKKIIILIFMCLIFVCGCENNKTNNENIEDTYIFNYEGLDIELGNVFSTEKYGKEEGYSEIESCAFDGLDKVYKYSNYEISTYPDGEKDRINSVYFLDDSIKTKEGIGITDTFDDMIKAYGKKYEKQDNLYTYTKNNTSIKFIIENNIIISIEYQYITK